MHVFVLNGFMAAAAGESKARRNGITFPVTHSPVLAVLITGRCRGGAEGSGGGGGDTGDVEVDRNDPSNLFFLSP